MKYVSESGVQGWAEEGFTGLVAQFGRSFEAVSPFQELGGSVSMYVDGACVVDIWGGFEDAAKTRAFRADALLCTFSAVKAMTSLCIHVAAEKRKLDLDHPIAEVWPEFAANGKGTITIRDVLTHQAGLQSVTDNDFAVPHDAQVWRQAIEAAVPRNPVGAVHSYHAISYGQILGEVIARSTGRSARDFFRDNIAAPLAADVHIGVSEAMLPRVCDVSAPSDADYRALSVPAEAAGFMSGVATSLNDKSFRTGVFPAGGGFSTARGLARIYAALANGGEFAGVKVCSNDTVGSMQRLAWDGLEAQSNGRWRMAQGLMLNTPPFHNFGPDMRSFGHVGFGGCVGFADPARKLAFSYFPARIFPAGGSGQRGPKLIAAAYESL